MNKLSLINSNDGVLFNECPTYAGLPYAVGWAYLRNRNLPPTNLLLMKIWQVIFPEMKEIEVSEMIYEFKL